MQNPDYEDTPRLKKQKQDEVSQLMNVYQLIIIIQLIIMGSSACKLKFLQEKVDKLEVNSNLIFLMYVHLINYRK